MRYYCARLVKPEQMPTEPRQEYVYDEDGRLVWDVAAKRQKLEFQPLDTNPLCGILGLPPRLWAPSKAYIGGRFSMPVVGGPREFCQPFEWNSFDEALAEVTGEQMHKLGLSFDWPVPAESVRWSLRLYSHADGSYRTAVNDLPWEAFRLRWLAAIGVSKDLAPQLHIEVKQRIVPIDGIRMPDCYAPDQCATYRVASRRETTSKPGAVDVIAELLA